METEKLVEQLKPLFQNVADKIGSGAEFSWEIVLRQQIACGIALLFVAIICLVICIFTYKQFKKDEEFISVVLSFFTGVCFVLFMMDAILMIYNPAYYALQFFMGLVK